MSRLRFLFHRKWVEQELDEELRFHLEKQIERNIAAGMSAEEARYAALRAFGGLEQAKEQCRDVRGTALIETLVQDVRYGLRMLRRSPGFTAAAVLSLALGIGANTAIFSLIDAVLLRMLPVKNPEELVRITTAKPMITTGDTPGFPYPTFERFRDRNEVLSAICAFADVPINVTVDGQTERVTGQLVSGSYFAVLGVNAVLGRTLTTADDRTPGSHPVTMISYGLWRRRFALDPAVVGKTIYVNRAPLTIVGVAPSGFFGTQAGRSPEVWIPMMMVEPVFGASPLGARNTWWLQIMGRLKPGLRREQARAALDVIFQQTLAETTPSGRRRLENGIQLEAGSRGLARLREQFQRPLLILMAVVGLVLLIACANVANLQLARATARQREIAVRRALGAGRLRLVCQLLTESVLTALAGGAFGLIFAFWGNSLLAGFLPVEAIPAHLQFRPDQRILLFTGVLSLLTAILFGLAPAFRATRAELTLALKGSSSDLREGGVGLPLGKSLVVSQVAVSLLLLIGAGLFLRTLQNLRNIDPGFQRENVLLVTLDPNASGYQGARALNLCRDLLERVQAIVGVQVAALSAGAVFGGPQGSHSVWVQGDTERPGQGVGFNHVSPRFFEAAGIPLVLGRDFGPQDDANSTKVAVINEAMARLYFPNENPLGKRFGDEGPGSSGKYEIVGVVKDAKNRRLRERAEPIGYHPLLQQRPYWRSVTLQVRTLGNPAAVISLIRREILSIDKSLPVFGVRTLVDELDRSITQERLLATLSSLFGLLALLLAAVGLYGVMAYRVARRTNELGIRMALGAQRGEVVWLVLRETLWLVVLGVCTGLPAALASTRLIASRLFGLSATDPATITAATLVMLAVAALAGYLPARRASQVDPVVALRYE